MTEFDIREGVILLQDKYYKSRAVFVKDEYYKKSELDKICKNSKNKRERLYVPENVIKSDKIEIEYKNYEFQNYEFQNYILKDIKELKILKYRPYLKVVKSECSIDETENILTFVLFNPSFANQYMLDETIKNCAYLTFKNNEYNGFEILNLFSLRDSKVNKKTAEKDCEYYFYEKVIFQNVVLAWGYSEFKTKIAKLRFNTINQKYKTGKTKYYELHRIDTNETKPFHFGNAFWSSQKLPFKKSLDAGKINLKQINEDEILN